MLTVAQSHVCPFSPLKPPLADLCCEQALLTSISIHQYFQQRNQPDFVNQQRRMGHQYEYNGLSISFTQLNVLIIQRMLKMKGVRMTSRDPHMV